MTKVKVTADIQANIGTKNYYSMSPNPMNGGIKREHDAKQVRISEINDEHIIMYIIVQWNLDVCYFVNALKRKTINLH